MTWSDFLGKEKNKPYFKKVLNFLRSERRSGKTVYPHVSKIFNALSATPLSEVRVVILGQDPYHGEGQAHGLAFSVQEGVRVPPSLINIFKELETDLGIPIPNSGNLENWAKQGVLLLNSVLTVEASNPASHSGRGWEDFTDKVIEIVNQEKESVVFMLWGNYAQKKGSKINLSKHLVLKAPHPSPLSAHRGFLGCKHFSKANDWLKGKGKKPVDWSLP